jgi:hypothetical protein
MDLGNHVNSEPTLGRLVPFLELLANTSAFEVKDSSADERALANISSSLLSGTCVRSTDKLDSLAKTECNGENAGYMPMKALPMHLVLLGIPIFC